MGQRIFAVRHRQEARRRERNRRDRQQRHQQEDRDKPGQRERDGFRAQLHRPPPSKRRLGETIKAAEQQPDDDDQRDADRRAQAPVRALEHAQIDEFRRHDAAAAAENRRRDEEAEREDEHDQRRADHARPRHRQEHLPEDAHARRAKAARGEQHPLVHRPHRGGEREGGERDQHMRHAEHDARLVARKLQRARDEARRLEPSVDEPAVGKTASQPKARVSTEIQNGMRMQSSATRRCQRAPRTQT